MNIKHGNTVAVLKEGFKRKKEENMPADTRDVLNIAGFDLATLWHPKTSYQQETNMN